MPNKKWYTWEDIGRKAGYCTLPKGGAWVAVVGCPAWPRGQRIIRAHRQIDIQHMDVYWGHQERFVVRFKVNRFRRRKINLPTAIAYDVSQGATLEEAVQRAVEEVQDYVYHNPHQTNHQMSLITLTHPHPEEVRLYNGEVRVFTPDTIRELLAADWLDVIPFGQTQFPALEEITRELVDAFQVDGLSQAEAYQQVIGCGLIDPGEQFIPQWFYRPKGEFRTWLCEEDD